MVTQRAKHEFLRKCGAFDELIELMCYYIDMENIVLVEFTIMQYDLNSDHLLTNVVMVAYYPLLKLDRNYSFTRSDIIDRLKHHEPVYITLGGQKRSLQLVDCDGQEYIRLNSEPDPRDMY